MARRRTVPPPITCALATAASSASRRPGGARTAERAVRACSSSPAYRAAGDRSSQDGWRYVDRAAVGEVEGTRSDRRGEASRPRGPALQRRRPPAHDFRTGARDAARLVDEMPQRLHIAHLDLAIREIEDAARLQRMERARKRLGRGADQAREILALARQAGRVV